MIDQDKLDAVNVAPSTESVTTVPARPITSKPGAEYFLNLSFKLAKDQLWAKAGYEVAAAQFKLPGEASADAAPAKKQALKLETEGNQIIVGGDGFLAFAMETRFHQISPLPHH